MSLRKIVKIGDPVLKRKVPLVKRVDKEILKLIDDMFETMYDAPGIGLAANQIGVPLCLAVIDLQHNGVRAPIVLINPKVVELKGRLFEDEGCLSIPGFSAKTKRYSFAKVSAINAQGLPVEYSGEGLMARALQHETDHLNGKFYIDHLTVLKRWKIQSEIRKRRKLKTW